MGRNGRVVKISQYISYPLKDQISIYTTFHSLTSRNKNFLFKPYFSYNSQQAFNIEVISHICPIHSMHAEFVCFTLKDFLLFDYLLY